MVHLVLPLALGALQLEDELLGGLRLLPQNGLGLTSEALLLTVVSERIRTSSRAIFYFQFNPYLLLPWACLDSADFLYWVTLNFLWDLHLGWGQ